MKNIFIQLSKGKKRLRAFTLVELLIVIAVIGIVSSIATVVSTQVLRQARDSERGAKSSIVASSLEKYYEKNNGYPSVAALVGQNTSTLKNKLSLANPNSLIFPLASNTSNASIVASNPSPTQMAYLGATSNAAANNQCQTDANGYCDAYEIQYNNETDGSIVVIKSANGVVTPSTPPPAAPNTPTVSAASLSASQVRITSTAVTCASGTPEYKIRNAPTSGGLPAWSTISWSTSRIKDYNPGSDTVVYFQANARCVESGVPSAEVQSSIQSMNIGSAPATPAVSATTINSSSIQLTFSASGATSYSVSGAGNASSCTSSPCTVTGLAASTNYTFTVTATNSYGTSGPGSASATTQPPACTSPSAPTISASASSSSAVNVSWSGVSGSSPITYYVYYGTSSPGSSYATSTTGTSASVSGLSSSTTYYFRVYAENSCGTSSYSNTASATTQSPPCSVPSTPSISAGSPSTNSISVSWGSASGATGYNVYYGTSSPGSSYYSNTSGTSMTVSGLSSSTTYYFRVVATNSCGSSGYSNTASATTGSSCTAPSAPSGLSASPQSANSILVNWGSSSGTSPISYSLSGVGSVSANSNSTRSGLSPNTSYSYTLTATNSCGSNSSSTSATTHTGTLSVSGSSVGPASNGAVSWTPSGGTAPPTPSYNATSTVSASGCGSVGTDTSCTFNYDTCNGTPPTVTITGFGASGTRSQSWPGAPAAPVVAHQASFSNGIRFTYTWDSNTTYSQGRYKKTGEPSFRSMGDGIAPGSSPYTLNSLASNTSYNIRIYSANCRYKYCDEHNGCTNGTTAGTFVNAPSDLLTASTNP